MTHVVTESCIRCKYTDCVDVCPVDAFREGPNMLAIDPDECIDCTLCVIECPVAAIFEATDVPTSQKQNNQLNVGRAARGPGGGGRGGAPGGAGAGAAGGGEARGRE